ncbi:MAG TPA: hypothetical protein VLT87_24730 [Thermoanaerobaculia bacterium]|nr:hypothetical protein [Thermoanaerobaculia bacterium]
MRDDELLHRFLLGELAEDEAESLERRLLQEDALFELCEAIESDLLAASARGELAPAENERVLARLAASPGGHARLALARNLVHAAQEAPAELTPAPLPFRPAAAPPPRRAARWAALAASLLFFAVGGSWVVNYLLRTMPPDPPVVTAIRPRPPVAGPTRPTPAPTEPVEPGSSPAEPPALPEPGPAPERPAAPEPAPSLTTAVFQLALAGRRSAEPAEELPRFEVPKGTGEIDIQLDLGGEEREFLTFNALVTNPEAGEVWRGQGLEPQSLDWGMALILKIPAESLPDGRYTMKVQGVKAEGEAETIGTQDFEIVAD